MYKRDRIAARSSTLAMLVLMSTALTGCFDLMSDKVDDDSATDGPAGGGSSFTQVEVQGSVGDGPIANSSIIVTTSDGSTIWEGPSESDADYLATMLVLPDDYPLFVSATGGTDLVTGEAPYLTMESSIIDEAVNVTNVNPFSTVIIATASNQPSGVTRSTVESSTDVVTGHLNFGLDREVFRDPIKTPVQPSNVATIIRSGMALSEMFRRTSVVMVAAGLSLTPDAVLASVARDLTDGVMDGRNSGISARVAATANLVSAQVALETLTNTLRLDGVNSMNSIDSAILAVRPNAKTMVNDLTATAEILAQTKLTVAAAYDFLPSTGLANLLTALDTVPVRASVSTARQRLPQNPGSLLDAAIEAIKTASASDAEKVNSRIRSGLAPDVADTVAPVITLLGPGTVQLNVGDAYVEHGATATDDRDGNISGRIAIDASNVDTSRAAVYTVTYDVSDLAGNAAARVRRTVAVSAVPVADTKPPVITLNGASPLNLTVGDSYVEPGATAIDDVDGNISSRVTINNSAVTTATDGTYQVTYNVSDTAGNRADEVIRNVVVASQPVVVDTTPPVITLLGANPLQLTVGSAYVEPGATATDNVDGNISSRISINSSNVNTAAAGTYSVRYNVSDSAGNAASQVTRTVNLTAPSGGSNGRAWEAVLNEAAGFARNVTGGAGGQLITVTNLNDSGSGSLRAALAVSGRTWIRFSPGLTGTIRLNSPLKPNPNTTIDGRGAKITLDWGGSGYGIYMTDTSNIIIMYLIVQNAGYDAIHFRNGFSGGWLHHITFDRTIDELISIRNGADVVTISWCRMNNNTRGALLRGDNDSEKPWANVYSHATMHHNYWTRGLSWRSPKMGNAGHFHIYNDYNEGDSMIHAINNAQVLVENSIFNPDTSGDRKLATTQDGRVDGLSKATGNLLLNNAELHTLHSEGVFTPPYAYAMDPATNATRDKIVAGAGWQNVPFPQ